ncbi:MAG: hypothetical protein ACK5LV_10580 [Lachnospirales bacterium]
MKKNKRKGALLVTVLICMVAFTIIAVPITFFIQQTGDTTSENIMENKSDEIAYAGFKVFEKYVVDNEQEFLASLDFTTSPDGSYALTTTSVMIPYADGTVTAPVSLELKTKTSDDGKMLKSVEVLATTKYSDIVGAHEETINFQTNKMVLETPKSVFPYSYYSGVTYYYPTGLYTNKDGTGARVTTNKGDLFANGLSAISGKVNTGKKIEPNLATRMKVNEIPKIDKTHVDYILNHPNSNVYTIDVSTVASAYVLESQIMEAINTLKSTGSTKPWQVIYIKVPSTYSGVVYVRFDDTVGQGFVSTSMDRYTKVDMSGFVPENSDDRVSLIFLCDNPIVLTPYYNGHEFSTGFLNTYFPNTYLNNVATAYYDLINCDMYFISYGVGQRGHNASVYNKDLKNQDELGQINFVSGSSDYADAWIGGSTNVFLYMPFHSNFAFGGSSAFYDTYDAEDIIGITATYGNTVNVRYGYHVGSYTYGGIVADYAGVLSASNGTSRTYAWQDEYTPVEWKGDPRLLGYWRVLDENGTVDNSAGAVMNDYAETEYNANYDRVIKPESE